MSTLKHGGQAYPSDGAYGGHVAGMSLRDYFAANAPELPAWDFPVRMPSPRPRPILPDGDSVDGWSLNEDALRAWDGEQARQRAIQWPWVWADAMLAERLLEEQPATEGGAR